MSDNLIVNVALTGCVATKGDNPVLPITPEEVAADARRCADEGAQVFHVHARDNHGNPVWGKGIYQTYIQAVREAVPGAIVCASLSGRHFSHFEQRSAALQADPDLASVTLGSVDFQDGKTSINGRGMVDGLLKLMEHWKVKPEFEVFDLGHCFRLQELARDGHLLKPVYANIILGVLVPAEIGLLGLLIQMLPSEHVWAGAGVGRDQWKVNKWSIVTGGHVRAGLEDNLWMHKGQRASNLSLVRRVVRYARFQGREPATLDQAREMLGLADA